MRVRVTISGPNAADRCPEFTKPEITIGRRPTNDVVVPDASASGAHARVLVTGGALTILDLDSTNGTAVNGAAVQGPRLLDEGDTVEIGDYRLQFSLQGGGTVAVSMPTGGHVAVPPSPSQAAPAVSASEADWPAPPPMIDDVEAAAPTSSAPAVVSADPRGKPPQPSFPPEHRSAMFPRLELSAAPSVPPSPPTTTQSRSGYEFQPASASVVLNRAFRAVLLRKRSAMRTATAGLREQVSEALQQALEAAAGAIELGDVARIGARMLEEMVGDGPLPNLLAGDPDEVLIVGTSRVRISRGGHVSEGPSPFTCSEAISCWVDRVCGEARDTVKYPRRGAFNTYAVRAVAGDGGMVVSLRRASTSSAATLEGLVRAGILSHGIATLLSACVVARLNILLCGGPGSNTEALMSALLACAPPNELQVVLGNTHLNAGVFQNTAVLLRRDDFGRDAIGSALALGPDRLGVDELQWGEAAAITGIVSRSMSHILGLRAGTSALGLGLFSRMIAGAVPPAAASTLVTNSVDIVVSTQLFADAVTRVTALSEPVIDDAGNLTARDIFALVLGTRTWQFSGVTPRCFEDITRRGFPLDPSVFA